MNRVFIIVPQCREEPTTYPPYGALQVGSYAMDRGYEVRILNLDLERGLSMEDVLQRVEAFKTDVLGFSGIVSNNYRYIKEMSREARRRWPDLFQVLGGQLTKAEKPVLENIPVDVMVRGEGEISFHELLDQLKADRRDFEKIDGLSFLRDGEIVRTPMPKLIQDLDSLPLPHYELIDMGYYCCPPERRYEEFLGSLEALDPRFLEPHRRGQNSFTIMTGRGCQVECTFCSRNMLGLRKNSHEYILDHIAFLKEKYNVGVFTFGDESFAPHKRWLIEFSEKLIARKLDILFYILGNRVDTVSPEALQALKKAGCFMVEYGFEHGSQRMLDTIEKRNSVAENYRAFQWTRDAGLHTVPSNVINMPGEDDESINESIEFLKSLKMSPPRYFVNYAQALPGTPLYDYSVKTGLIPDEDKYLSDVTDVDAADSDEAMEKGVLLNFSNLPIKDVLAWQGRFAYEVEMDYLRRTGGTLFYWHVFRDALVKKVPNLLKRLRREGLGATARHAVPRLKALWRALAPRAADAAPVAGGPRLLDQYRGDLDAELVRKIKFARPDERRTEKHPHNPHLERYVDSYDGQIVVRHASLREVTQKMGFWEPHHLKKRAAKEAAAAAAAAR